VIPSMDVIGLGTVQPELSRFPVAGFQSSGPLYEIFRGPQLKL
jgi:hypothetical protein